MSRRKPQATPVVDDDISGRLASLTAAILLARPAEIDT